MHIIMTTISVSDYDTTEVFKDYGGLKQALHVTRAVIEAIISSGFSQEMMQ